MLDLDRAVQINLRLVGPRFLSLFPVFLDQALSLLGYGRIAVIPASGFRIPPAPHLLHPLVELIGHFRNVVLSDALRDQLLRPGGRFLVEVIPGLGFGIPSGSPWP